MTHRVLGLLALVGASIGAVWGQPAFAQSAFAQPAWTQPSWNQPALAGLPAAVVATIEEQVAAAMRGPELRLAERRERAASDASLRSALDWDVGLGARSDPAGLGWHGSGSVSYGLVDPALPRRRAEARSATDAWTLDGALARRDAAADALSTWLAAWAARERLAIARAVADASVDSAAEARRVSAWRARLPALELEAEIGRRRLAALGVPAPVPWPTAEAWRGWATAPLDASDCAAEPLDVRVARAEVERLRREIDAGQLGAALPSVRIGFDLSVASAAEVGAPTSLSGRLWLRLGMPTSWPARGSLRASADGGSSALDLSVGPALGDDELGWRDLELEIAEARLADVLREARDRRAMTRVAWAAEVAALSGSPRGGLQPGAPLARFEAMADAVSATVAAVHLRAELRLACLGI